MCFGWYIRMKQRKIAQVLPIHDRFAWPVYMTFMHKLTINK